jgi:hypothetical protein
MRRGEGGVRTAGFVETEGKELMRFLHLGKDLVPVGPGEDFTREAGGGGFAICKCGDGTEQVVQAGNTGLRAPAPADPSGPLLVGLALARDRAGVYLRNFRRCC